MPTIQEACDSLRAHYVANGTMPKLQGVNLPTPPDWIRVVEKAVVPSFNLPEGATGVGWQGYQVKVFRQQSGALVLLQDSGPIA